MEASMRRLFGPLGLAALNHNPFCSRQPDGHLRKHCIGRPLLPARESRSLRWWNNRRLCGLWCALALLSALPLASAAETLTLEQAVRFAEAHSAALRSAEAELDAAQGALADARALLWNNPELAAEGRRRKAPQLAGRGDANGEWGAGLSQTFEIAGQQGHRRAAAEQALAAAQEMVAATRRALRAEVERRFVRLLTLEQRIALEERLLQVFEKTATAIARRVQVGENNRLEGNLARIEQERVGNQLSALAEQRSAAQGELASLLQWPGADLPMVSGTLERPASHALAGLLDAAQASAAMRALAHREEAARSRLDLEQAALYPDVTVGLGFSS
jgi:cobalt-zinc-cadmium efflux system outer membrane protein